MSRHVYFIRPIGMQGPVKIGCSATPDGRRRSLETWSPFPLEIIASVEGDFELEKRFHALFRQDHERREWFRWSQRLQDVVDSINLGAFDISSLPAPVGLASCVAGIKRERTPEQRLQASFSQRAWRTTQRTGFAPPTWCDGIVKRNDPEELALAERYFAEPHIYGRELGSKSSAERRETYLNLVARTSARAA